MSAPRSSDLMTVSTAVIDDVNWRTTLVHRMLNYTTADRGHGFPWPSGGPWPFYVPGSYMANGY
jgi:hypothetical protein